MRCAEARLLLSLDQDGELPPAERLVLADHLASCVGCRGAARGLGVEQAMLRQLWPNVSAPTGFADRVAAGLSPTPPHHQRPAIAGVPRRWLAAAAAALVVLLGGSVIAQPAAWASLSLLVRRVVLRETVTINPQRTVPVGRLTLDQAQALVPWPIVQPTDLPDGYRLVAVEADAVHAFAIGPTIILHYQRPGAGAVSELALIELQAASDVSEPVAPGATREVPMDGGRSGLFIDGQWVEHEGRQVWQSGTLARLILERGDIIAQLQGDPRHGWDAAQLARVAASLR